MQKLNPRFDYGAVLLLDREDTRKEVSARCNDMRDMGMNTLVLWPPLFYENGEPDLSRQKMVLDCAAEAGLSVIIELTGQVSNLEYLPDCLWKPEYAVLDEDGKPALMQNGLGELNYNHPEVQQILKNFFQTVIPPLMNHPALVGWDIWNETHFLSYDPITWKLFQDWLKNKYSDISALNQFWAKSYTDFSQIRRDPVTWASVTPETDWQEFRVQNLADIARQWREIVHELDPVHFVIADNVMTNPVWSEFDRGTDDRLLADAVGNFGISFYPKTGGRLLKDGSPSLRRLTFAGADMASRGKGFTVSEMQSHYYSDLFPTERVEPDELLDWCEEALFSHCRGIFFWKLRPFVSGFQCGGRGLLLADGRRSVRGDAAAQFGALLAENPSLRKLRPASQVSLVYDRASCSMVHAMNNRIRHIIGDAHHVRALGEMARLLHERNIPFQTVTIQDDIPDAHLLILPFQLVLDQAGANNLLLHLHAGGSILACAPFGDISPEGRLHKALPGGPIHDIIGVTLVDNINDSFHGQRIDLPVFEPADETEVLLRSDSGQPILFRRMVGNGTFWFSAIGPTPDVLDAIGIRSILPPISSHAELSIADDGTRYLLIPNEERAPFITIQASNLTLLAGQGKLVKNKASFQLQNARHSILRLEE
ncbi:MAG: beta-galactosidase [Victivallales bacterium]|nr:beta-galactosidase [Victivallales bacterium]